MKNQTQILFSISNSSFKIMKLFNTHSWSLIEGQKHTGIPWTPWMRTAPKFSPVFETDGEQEDLARVASVLVGDGVHPPPCPDTDSVQLI
jgi:hypothetical protein